MGDVYDDDNEEETESELSDEEQAALEEKFQKAYEKASSKINKQLEIAREAISKAEEISEEYGIPFCSDITPLSMSYRPESYSEKWGDLDGDLNELTGGEIYSLPEYEGWEHSAVCW